MARNTTQPPGNRLVAGQRLRVLLERPAAQGRTVAHADGEGLVLLVSRGVPQETVEVELERIEARHALARVVTVERPAPERVDPPCPHYAACGGCDLQHVSYPAQLDIKRRAFLDQLERIGGIAAPPHFEIVPSPEPLRYRDRLDFFLGRGDAKEALRPGFHGVNGKDFVPIDECLLAPPELTQLARDAAGLLASVASPAAIARVRVQAVAAMNGGSNALALTLFAATPSAARSLLGRREGWLAPLLAAHPELVHVSSVAARGQPEEPHGREEDIPPATLLHGEPLPLKRAGAWTYRAPPEAFFQAHPVLAARLVSHVTGQVNRHAARQAPRESKPAAVLDLFSGTGLFAFPLAAAGHRVLGLEQAEHAVRAARRTAREAYERGGFGTGRRPEFKVRDLGAKGALEEAARSFGLPDVVVADPPRRGLSGHLVRGLLALRPSALVYVSCDGGTFARDAARLAERYDLEQVTGFDLFPQTHHSEVVGVFTAR